MRLIHRSPLGALIIPGVLGAIPVGEPFEVPDEAGTKLLRQKDIFSKAPEQKGTAK